MRTPAKLATTAAVLVGLSTVATGGGTYAAFSASTENTANNFNAGTVSLTDNDAGAAMFNVSAMRPGDTHVGCIRVTYTGSLTAPVKLYGASTGALPPFLDLTVERGTMPANAFVTEPNAADGCTGFTTQTTLFATGKLNTFPTSYATGVNDPGLAAAAPLWATNENHVYRVTVTLPSAVANGAQGQTAATTFSWEAQS